MLFLNSDIGIVILYIVKYIRKAFSLPKKINFEVQNLTNIHVFRFAFSDLYCYHTDLQNAQNAVSDNLIFKISRRGMPPDPPSKERLRCSLVRIINWSHPPVKNPGYGPGDTKLTSTIPSMQQKLSKLTVSRIAEASISLFCLQRVKTLSLSRIYFTELGRRGRPALRRAGSAIFRTTTQDMAEVIHKNITWNGKKTQK